MNTEWAMQQLRTFLVSARYDIHAEEYGRHSAPEDQLVAQAQIIEQIFDRVIRDWRDDEKIKNRRSFYDHWDGHREIAQRVLSQLQREEELAKNLGDAAPDLSAAMMHHWVWDGARSLWASNHFREAVTAAAVKVNAETQNKLKRFDISEAKLFQEGFSLKSPEAGKPRLRLMADDGSETYKSIHEGALAFATGCYRAIRNPAAHVHLGDLPEDEALEQLAAFSILARWVDSATLDTAP